MRGVDVKVETGVRGMMVVVEDDKFMVPYHRGRDAGRATEGEALIGSGHGLSLSTVVWSGKFTKGKST